MAKTWILDTETKGTGANVVPLKQRPATAKPSRELFVPRRPAPRPEGPAEPRPARRYKVVDVVSGRVLAEDVETRVTVEVLAGVRSIVDVHVSVWQPERERWRMLSLDELRALWAFRARG
ncbi:MAG: hypothetical protein QOG15_595 [Solirubrobacteraceae bacterium]|nr:hypothetical protein [Solirubrobacteraceae bacterium]